MKADDGVPMEKMKHTISCTACGAEYEYGALKCPYCGNVEAYGAEKHFMEGMQEMSEGLHNLADSDAVSGNVAGEDHDANMSAFAADYGEAKQAVAKKVKRHNRLAWQQVVAVVPVIILAVMLYVHFNAFEVFRTKALEWDASAHVNEYSALLDSLLEEGDYLAFESFCHHYNLNGILDGYNPYRELITATRGYSDVMNRIAADLINAKNEKRTVPSGDMAAALLRFYDGRPDQDEKEVYFRDMEDNLKMLFAYYYGIQEEEFNTFQDMVVSELKAYFEKKRGAQ